MLGGWLYRGAASGAGDIGHLRLTEDGPLRGCGNNGCVEAYCGDGALTREAVAAARAGRSAALADRLAETGTLTVADVAAAAAAGDPARRPWSATAPAGWARCWSGWSASSTRPS